MVEEIGSLLAHQWSLTIAKPSSLWTTTDSNLKYSERYERSHSDAGACLNELIYLEIIKKGRRQAQFSVACILIWLSSSQQGCEISDRIDPLEEVGVDQ